MSQTILALAGIYLFIAVGFSAKYFFKEKIDDKTITILSVYFLQVFLTFWGLLKRPIDATELTSPIIYLAITLFSLLLFIPLAKIFFSDIKERSIATVAALIGNTGNLGIPLAIAIFGEESIFYTTLINLVNVFVVYTIGVFYYSRGEFSLRDSLLNILKLPVLWAATVAIVLNIIGYRPSEVVNSTLMMGAYASMTIQLVLFGIYMYDIKLREISRKLTIFISTAKFIIIPLITYVVLINIDLSPMIKGIIFLQLLVPLAVANVNLASLYNSKPSVVTAQVFITTLIFLAILLFFPQVLMVF